MPTLIERKTVKYMKVKYPYIVRKYTEYDKKEYFAVDVPDLPGCRAHGETLEKALDSLQESKRLWIEYSLRKKLNIPEPSPGKNIYICEGGEHIEIHETEVGDRWIYQCKCKRK